jgi:hypothetical protein
MRTNTKAVGLMGSKKRKILILVEGEKAEPELITRLIELYNLDIEFEIVSYCTNFHVLYDELFGYNEQFGLGEIAEEELEDLRLLLRRREKDEEKKKILNDPYSETWLIFDLEPQDERFDDNKVRRMVKYFSDPTAEGRGKLYINYPMVEAFYHMKSIPDYDFGMRTATLTEIKEHRYKKRVGRENRVRNLPSKCNVRCAYNTVIGHHWDKAFRLAKGKLDDLGSPDQAAILEAQLIKIAESQHVSVLSTCAFFITEYDPKKLTQKS